MDSELDHVSKYERQLYPVAILLAGQPGAGKTLLSSILYPNIGERTAPVNRLVVRGALRAV